MSDKPINTRETEIFNEIRRLKAKGSLRIAIAVVLQDKFRISHTTSYMMINTYENQFENK